MKTSRTVSRMVPGALLAVMVSHELAHAQGRLERNRACSNATNQGGWGFHVGATAPDGTAVAVLGRQFFDGKGSWTGIVTINANGTILHVNDDSGTYTVRPDCTGTITNSGGGTVDFVLVDGGTEVYFIPRDPGGAVFLFTGAKKQFPDDNNEQNAPFGQTGPNADKRCTNGILQGSYGSHVGATVSPAGTPVAVLGHQIFDGRGGYSGTVTIQGNGTVTHASDFGTYDVNADCTGKIFSRTGGGTFEFVLVDGGKEAYFLQTDPSAAVFLLAVAKKQFPSGNSGR